MIKIELTFNIKLKNMKLQHTALKFAGKMSSDNSPAVCVWNIKKGSHKFLASPQPFCPFRWFEKVDVSQGRVFGLLNRRCLLAWNADNGEYLFRLDLTENAPGLNEVQPLSFTYLTVHKHLFATIHQNPCCQAVYEIGMYITLHFLILILFGIYDQCF